MRTLRKSKKKKGLLGRFRPYMGNRAILIPISLLMSALSAVLSIIPFVMIWYLLREMLGTLGQLNMDGVMFYAWLAFGGALLSVITYFVALLSSHLAAFRVESGMQSIGMEKVLNMPIGFFEKNSSGKIRKIVTEGASTTHGFLAHQLPDLAGSIVTPLVLVILFFVIDWRMGIATLLPVVLGFVSMSFMMSKKGQAFQKQYFDALEEMSSEAVEYVRGIPVVKTFCQSMRTFNRFHSSITRYKDMVYAYTLLWRKPMSFYVVAVQSAILFLLPVVTLMIGRGEAVEVILVDYVFYLLISPVLGSILMKSMHFQQNIMVAKQAIDRLEALTDYPKLYEVDLENNQVKKRVRERNDIEFRNVEFTYDTGHKPAVDGVSFKLKEGETVAIVGASGSGKTTVARLAARFWDIDQGEILIGGVNSKEIPKEALMDRIAFVFQNTKLFKTTLKDNIQFGKKNVNEQHIHKVISLSRSREIIDQLPLGLETMIGKKGTYLSGGEQQRIAIARAMIKDAPIVLLDEATAFADPENEHLIQKSLKELCRGKTTMIIAHRLTSIQHVDKIIVMDRGKIIETGTHDTLMVKKGIYSEMWEEYQKSVAWKLDVATS